IESFREPPVDIVGTDLFMPEKDVLETIWDLRNEFPEVEIVVISGVATGNMDFFQAAIETGAVQCIRKPLSVEDIKGIVE
ncbi:MAG: response regulator, partial [Nitrospirae bacterium]|nr:response regulator [Nitrospirota bacterium]